MERGFKSWCEKEAIQQRKDLGLEDTDPLDPYMLTEKLGIKVLTANEVPGLKAEDLNTLINKDKNSWSAVTINNSNSILIILNPSHSKARTNSDLMHELSHLIIGHETICAEMSKENLLLLSTFDRLQEEEANWLAGCLLLPRTALSYLHYQRIPDEQVQADYGVSKVMLDYRVRMTGINRQFK